MCEVVLDFGNEIEMRALYKRQRHSIIPALSAAALIFNILAIFFGMPRWTGGEIPADNIDLLCSGMSIILSGAAIRESLIKYEDWIKKFPQHPRIAGD